MDAPEFQAQVQKILTEVKYFAKAEVKQLEQLAGDVSTRRFIRVHLSKAHVPSIIMMMLAQGMGVGGGPRGLTQDETFVELQGFFRNHGVRVPELYHYGRKHGSGTDFLLVEDIGDAALWKFVQGELGDREAEVADLLGSDHVLLLMKKCIDIIAQLQGIERDPESIAFQRSREFEQYRKEISEFIDHYALRKGLRRAEQEVLDKVFDAICESLMSHPKTLAHYDFMTHNLFADEQGEMVVIDFQDALGISPVRDVVSLLNDRSTNEGLGKDRQRELLKYYMAKLKVGAEFFQQYNEYLLHWDFRVSGRFSLLVHDKGRDHYGQWLPSTLIRIGRTLLRSSSYYPWSDDMIEILSRLSGEIKDGLSDPWDMPQLGEE